MKKRQQTSRGGNKKKTKTKEKGQATSRGKTK